MLTSKVDSFGRDANQLADDGCVDNKNHQRNGGKGRQVGNFSDVVLDQPLIVGVELQVVGADSQEVVVLELDAFEVGLDQLQADLDSDADDYLCHQNLQSPMN